jgi:uncharacterized repeat protein (TIGR03806 family)
MRKAFVALSFCLLLGCSRQTPPVVVFPAHRTPDQLSAWGVVLSDGDYFELNENVLPYDLNTPLFTDYALKMRTVWVPDGKVAFYDASNEFNFPVGTIISKTFHYEKATSWSEADHKVVRSERESGLDGKGQLDLDNYTLIETRLLVRYEDGWRAYPYVWNAAQNEAWLEIAGDVRNLSLVDESGSLDFLYVVPDSNQCRGCHAPNHTDADIRPIGPKARHLNRLYNYGEIEANQIEHWETIGVLRGVGVPIPTSALWANPGKATVEERARAYLDINCGHCHNSAGAADTSGLHLNIEAPLDRNFGVCKSPTAVGQGSGDRLYDIYPGKPEESILIYRMDHTGPAIAMPELGRSTVHAEGVLIVSEWIAGLEGGC